MRSEKSKAQQREYDKNQTVMVTVKLNRTTDAVLIKWLECQENRAGYIKELIRQDMGPAERNALATLLKVETGIAAAEAMRADGVPEEEVEAWIDKNPGPSTAAVMAAKRTHMIRTTMKLTAGERMRLQQMTTFDRQVDWIKEIKNRLGVSWSEMEAIWGGYIRI